VIEERAKAYFRPIRLFEFHDTSEDDAPAKKTGKHARKVLILPVSPQNVKSLVHAAPGPEPETQWTYPTSITLNEIGADIKNVRPKKEKKPESMPPKNEPPQWPVVAPNWNWWPAIRALRAHFGMLERVVLLGSRDMDYSPGSTGELDLMEQLVKFYFPHLKKITVKKDLPFEKLDELYESIKEVLDELQAEGYLLNDIVIDATAGQKTTSIAAALATLANKYIAFQYVQTNPPFSVITYNYRWGEAVGIEHTNT
jgi:hypothetical protein